MKQSKRTKNVSEDVSNVSASATQAPPQEKSGKGSPKLEKQFDEGIRLVFARIAAFCADYKRAGGRPIPSNSPTGQVAIGALNRLMDLIARALPEVASTKWKMSVSKGQTYFPKVPWIAICPAGKSVSTSPSVVVCFASRGEGAVAGVMESSFARSGRFTTVKRKQPGTILRVDVGGDKRHADYNNLFVNPKEFLMSTFRPEELISHLRASVALLEADISPQSKV